MRKYSFKDLFGAGNVAYVPAPTKREAYTYPRSIHALASHYGAKVSVRLGVWVDSKEAEAVRMFRVELISAPDTVVRKCKEPSVKVKKMQAMRSLGLTLQEIADKFNCTRQAVSAVLKYHERGKNDV